MLKAPFRGMSRALLLLWSILQRPAHIAAAVTIHGPDYRCSGTVPGVIAEPPISPPLSEWSPVASNATKPSGTVCDCHKHNKTCVGLRNTHTELIVLDFWAPCVMADGAFDCCVGKMSVARDGMAFPCNPIYD